MNTELNTLCGRFYAARPTWITGYIGTYDAKFLFKSIIEAKVTEVVEIGTASGLSTAVIAYALETSHKLGNIGPGFKIVSYDASPNFYADKTKRVGDAAREQLSPELLEHITFKNPAFAFDAAGDYGKNGIEYLFIDANHDHPWPTLDFLTLLDSVKPGNTVVFHDINLPAINPNNNSWGVKYLFDELEIEKTVPDDGETPNIGSVIVPEDKEQLKSQLLKILFAHEWQTDVAQGYLDKIGIVRTS